jgi:hypothetical protein
MSPRTPRAKRKVSLSHFRIFLPVALLFFAGRTYGQLAGNGNSGITTAASTVNGYFNIACTLLYAIGGIVGLIGAVKVFNAWNSGDPNTNKLAAAWFGSCVFLVVVATVLKSFFGVGS